jgi:ribose transport system permease protein
VPDVMTEPTPTAPPARRIPGVLRGLSVRNASAVYVFIVLFVVFALWVPDTFLRWNTWNAMLDDQAITALVAVALVIPLAAGGFNLAIGAEVGFAAMFIAWLLERRGVPAVPAVLLTLLAGATVGLAQGLLVVRARIDSFIATLGASSILLALIAWLSGGAQILGLSPSFSKLGTNTLNGITYPVYFMLAVALAVWYFLERAPGGRRLYATGGNAEASRLAGVRTSRVIILSFVGCGVITAIAGTLISARLSTGDPSVGPAYLLPAFSAAFLGSTQFRGGRFNVWGTVLAVYVLATGVKGLQLAGAPVWIPDLFNGAALLIAVGMAKYQGTGGRAAAIGRLLRRGDGAANAEPAADAA